MSRLWSQVSVRVLSVALLLVGVVGGLYLGQDRDVQERTAQVDQVAVADQAELDLLKQRHAEHAAARATQREAEADAAAKAAEEAKAAATKSRKLEAASIEKAKKDKEKAEQAKKEKEAKAKEDDAEPKPFTGPIPASCDEFTGNRKIGCAMVLAGGWDLEQFACLNKLWKKESGWNHKALNSGSRAYGIPQALPGSRMATAGPDLKTNPETQIEWGLDYIKGRYNAPCKAWAHSQSHNWY